MLKYFGTGTSGNPDIAEFMFVLEVDDTEVLYCDASKKIVEPRQDGVKKMLDDNPGALGEYTQECFEHQPGIYQNSISNLKQLLNQSGGAVLSLIYYVILLWMYLNKTDLCKIN